MPDITGDDIIAEILRNSAAGEFKIRSVTLLPSIYRVYLHPADFDMIRPVVPALIAEARAALIERVDALNKAAKPSAVVRALGFDSGKVLEYKILDPDWTVEFHPDAEEKLGRGEIEIFSELASAARPEFDGAMTRHVTKRQFSADAPTVQVSKPAPPADTAFARIRYPAAEGEQSFAVAKDKIVIGRGGKTFWVDLQLVAAPPDVSREHCRIRRDPATGRFFLKDVSAYGTAIDGRPVPSSIDRSGPQERDIDVEVPLPDRASISLAGVVTLEWEVVQ